MDTYNNGYNLTIGGSGARRYDIEKIYQKYLENNNMNETARFFNCSAGTVRKVMRIFGINKYELGEAKAVEKIDPKTLEVITTYSSTIGMSHQSLFRPTPSLTDVHDIIGDKMFYPSRDIHVVQSKIGVA